MKSVRFVRGVAMLLSVLCPCGSAGNGDFAMKWSTRRGETGAEPPAEGHNVWHISRMSLLLMGEHGERRWKECWHARLQSLSLAQREKNMPLAQRRRFSSSPFWIILTIYNYLQETRLDLGETGEIWFAATTSRTLGFAHHLRVTPDAGKHRVDSLNERRPGWAQLRVPVEPAEDRTTTARRELPQSFSGHGTKPTFPTAESSATAPSGPNASSNGARGGQSSKPRSLRQAASGGRRGIAIGVAGVAWLPEAVLAAGAARVPSPPWIEHSKALASEMSILTSLWITIGRYWLFLEWATARFEKCRMFSIKPCTWAKETLANFWLEWCLKAWLANSVMNLSNSCTQGVQNIKFTQGSRRKLSANTVRLAPWGKKHSQIFCSVSTVSLSCEKVDEGIAYIGAILRVHRQVEKVIAAFESREVDLLQEARLWVPVWNVSEHDRGLRPVSLSTLASKSDGETSQPHITFDTMMDHIIFMLYHIIYRMFICHMLYIVCHMSYVMSYVIYTYI